MDPKVIEAQAKLRAAIVAYYDELYPGSFIDDWTVVVHRQSLAMEARNESTVSTTIPDGQPSHRTIGLLQMAMSSVEESTYCVDDED